MAGNFDHRDAVLSIRINDPSARDTRENSLESLLRLIEGSGGVPGGHCKLLRSIAGQGRFLPSLNLVGIAIASPTKS